MYISRNLRKKSRYSVGEKCRFSDANECSPVSRIMFDSFGIRIAMQETTVKLNLELESTATMSAGNSTSCAQGYYLDVTSCRLYIWSFFFNPIEQSGYFFTVSTRSRDVLTLPVLGHDTNILYFFEKIHRATDFDIGNESLMLIR